MALRVERTIDHFIYSREAIADARQAYREFCNVKITRISSNQAILEIYVSNTDKNQAREIVLNFLNYALDRAAQLHFGAA